SALAFDLDQSLVGCLTLQLLLDPQQLIVLGNPIRTAQGACLDLSSGSTHCQIGNCRIFGFAGTVRNHRRVSRVFSHFNGVQSLGQAANLVKLDQNRVASLLLDTFFQNLGVGDKQVITDQLHTITQLASKCSPSCPVVLRHAIFD